MALFVSGEQALGDGSRSTPFVVDSDSACPEGLDRCVAVVLVDFPQVISALHFLHTLPFFRRWNPLFIYPENVFFFRLLVKHHL